MFDLLDPEEWLVVRVIATFALVAAMAYLLNLPAAKRWQARLGIAQLVVAGLPFVLLGMLARAPGIGVLDAERLARLDPLVAIVLAVVGIRVGLRVDLPHLLATPRATVTLAAGRFALVGLGLFAVLTLVQQAVAGHVDTIGLRAIAVLAIAGTVTSAAAAQGLTGIRAIDDIPVVERAIRIGELASILALLVLAAYIEPTHEGAPGNRLPPELWLLTGLGLAVALGTLVFQLFRDRAASSEDAPVIAIGAVSIVAGISAYLGFSPLAIGLLVGVTLGQLAGVHREGIEAAFDRYQRAIYGVLLFLLGAHAIPITTGALVVTGVFVLARLVATLVATRLAMVAGRLAMDPASWRRLVVAPLGATSVALVIAAHQLYPDAALAPVGLALITAALVTEVIWQVHERRREARR